MGDKKAVYKVYGGGDCLLYVGSSGAPLKRILAHCIHSPWAHQITKIVISEMMPGDKAAFEEGKSIDNESPLHNRNGRRAYRGPSYKPTGAGVEMVEKAKKRAALAAELKASGRTFSEVGRLMGITRQRAQQLAAKVSK